MLANKTKKYFLQSFFGSSNKYVFFSKKYLSTVPAKPSDNTQLQSEMKEKTLISEWKHLENLKKCEYDLILLKEQLEKDYKYFKEPGKVVQEWDIPKRLFHINQKLEFSLSYDNLIYFVKNYRGLLETYTIFYRFFSISKYQDFNRELFTVLLPVLKDYMVKFDRHMIMELYFGAVGAANLNVADTEFWSIVETKMINEGLYKYLRLDLAVDLAFQLKKSERISNVLLKLLELEFVKHRKAIHAKPKLLKKVKETYLGVEGTSEVLIAALGDPNIEISKGGNKLI